MTTVEPRSRAEWSGITARIADFRAAKIEGLRRAGRQVGVELAADLAADPRAYALTHHYVYAVAAAVREGALAEAETLSDDWASGHPGGAPELLPGHPVAIADHRSCVRHDDQDYESPLYLALRGAEVVESTSPAAALWHRAAECVAEAGLDWIVRSALGVVVTLDAKGRTDTTESYTLKALPGTVFIDTVHDPVRLGELILHESAHALLNDVFGAFQVELSSESRWYSPWKGVPRPAYGILHAGFAFGVLQRYFEYFGRSIEPASAYARVRAETGAEQWDAARTAVDGALQEVRRAPVEELLRAYVG